MMACPRLYRGREKRYCRLRSYLRCRWSWNLRVLSVLCRPDVVGRISLQPLSVRSMSVYMSPSVHGAEAA